ncbi:hypothetical protein HOD05_02135 [Candidatus Woesearchaeota archaeon]|jgi:hypothetical protein|nr:hypothetical protein [Candidatus Woesearchaeota archaeon]MBT4151246.1 hypothetical protein [Candidatus Woesearchaeota archaeon]MBT4247281.1 hypothetical protein [Candidatus Woesearchaeota archaeon]MBT4433994.1 hypothetical protein [Candidatus Woesearchaeota archaeon]MBT7332391.1 hypothetical protein [Candidatus Woesearchaeota archaeon]
MEKKKRLELKEKGWTEQELKKAERIMEHDVQQSKSFSRLVFWSALIVILFANLAVSLVLIPFLIVFSAVVLYSVIVLLGISFGFLYNFLISTVGTMHKGHHRWTNILVPIVAMINIIIVVLASNFFISKLESNPVTQNPFMAGIVFAIAFVLPYMILKLFFKK